MKIRSLNYWQITALEQSLREAIKRGTVHYGSATYLLELLSKSERIELQVNE